MLDYVCLRLRLLLLLLLWLLFYSVLRENAFFHLKLNVPFACRLLIFCTAMWPLNVNELLSSFIQHSSLAWKIIPKIPLCCAGRIDRTYISHFPCCCCSWLLQTTRSSLFMYEYVPAYDACLKCIEMSKRIARHDILKALTLNI